MTTTPEVKSATSAELHALWGMIEANAELGSADCQIILERWTEYVLAQRERFPRH